MPRPAPHPSVPLPAATAELCDVRLLANSGIGELYITAAPAPGEQAVDVYSRVADVLRRHKAYILQERLFASDDGFDAALAARADVFGDLSDDVAPTCLRTGGATPGVHGVQMHAVFGINRPSVLKLDGKGLARAVDANGCRSVIASGLSGAAIAGPAAQALSCFEAARSLLSDAGGALTDLARTWLWMDDILAWYDELNHTRNAFFVEQGVMGANNRMPASTGIGVSPRAGRIAVDFVACFGGEGAVQRFAAAGNQRSAYEYGSAFARSATARTPAGTTVFCSGTAAIDAAGRTCLAGDIAGQVRMTVENVAAVLRDMRCEGHDVVQAMAYCATPAVLEQFQRHHADLPWPCLAMIGDVCRDDLLFEVEVTACPGATLLHR